MAPLNRDSVLAGVMLLVTLLVGIAAGVAIDRWALRPEQRERAPRAMMGEGGERRAPRFDAAEFRDRFTRQLARELELTEAQQVAADSLLRLQQAEARAAMRELRPRLDSIYRSTEADLRTILTPEQMEKWQALRQRRGAR